MSIVASIVSSGMMRDVNAIGMGGSLGRGISANRMRGTSRSRLIRVIETTFGRGYNER
jgi:hypothetical protein